MADPPAPLADLRRANAELTAARRAAISLLEDAVQARDALRAGEAWLRGQRKALEAALNGAPLAESLGALVRTATDALGEGTRGAFYLTNDDGTTLHHVVGMPAEYAAAVEGFKIGSESLACGRATAIGEPLLTPDVMADPRWESWREVAARFDYRGCWSFPIHTEAGRFVGTFAVYSRSPRAATARDLELASLLTHTAAIIISRHAGSDARRRAEADRARSEGQLRLLLENVRDHAIFALGPTGDVASWNEGAERLLGYAAGEVVGTSAAQFFAPEDRAAGMFERELATAAAAGRAADDNWVARKDGSRFWASGSTSAIPGPAHRPAGFVKVFRDRTEHRAANEAVRDARDRLRLALAAARMGIWSWHVPTNAQTRDANLNRLLGLPAEETAQPFDEFLTHIHPDDRAPVRAAFDASVRHDRPLNSEFRVVWSDGTVRWLRDQGDVFGAGGPDRHMAGVCVDITDLKAAEDALRQARDELEDRVRERTAELVAAEAGRRELLGRLVTGQEEERRRIARELHDSLGQYLTALGLGLATARDAAATPETRGRLDRLTELTAETGREVHRLATELRPTALDDLGLRTSLQQHVEAWAARTGVTAEFAARGLDGERFPWQVSTAVYRVVQEALTNVARHARAARVSVLVERGVDFLRAIVEDDGVGFDPDRTRADPRTGGLGLLGMRERVALVNGTLQIESSPDGGTTVFVRVPVPPQEPDDHE